MKQENTNKKLPGFYIALCCCVIAIGAAGYFLQESDSPSSNTVLQPDEYNTAETITLTDNTSPAPTEAAVDIATEPPVQEVAVIEEVYDYTYDNPDIAASSIVVNAEEAPALANPIPDITVLDGFSGDTLIYNETYADWRSHNGIDIEAELGCSVCAAADGTVTAVTDGSYGKEVRIEHADSLTTVYAQLGEVNVSAGDNVTSGSVIGTVGKPIGENTKSPHLHYEVYKNNKLVNPEDY